MNGSRGKCRILYVIHDLGVGGAQKQVVETVNRLDPERFSADVACITRGGVNEARLKGAREVFVLGASKIYDGGGISAALRLADMIHRGRYTIVEAYLPSAHFLSALALVGRPRTALVAARRQEAGLDPLWMSAARSFLNRATLFSIANSRAVKCSVVRRYGLRPARVAVVPNFVSMPGAGLMRDEARRRIGIPADAFTVVATGSISAVKDYPTIVKAVAAMRRRRGNVTLVVAGGGKGRSGMVLFARGLGLDGSARFLGAVEDVETVLSAGDVFVHASRSEGMSNAVLEAMSAGLPVVASDIPANREALGDGCAEFFEPGDWAGCLKGLDRFADDTAAAIDCGREARERVKRVFDCGAVVARRERIYRRLAEVVNGAGQQ